MRNLIFLLVAGVIMSVPTRLFAAHIYVDGATGSDSYSGFSWAEAKKTIQAGLSLSAMLPGVDTVLVAEGTYLESITLVPFTMLLGGFPAGGGIRDPEIHVSTIQGLYNLHNVIGADDATIDGFTITGGYFEGYSYPDLIGGAIYCDHTSPVISNNKITGNRTLGHRAEYDGDLVCQAYAGGIYCLNSDALIINNIISDNAALGSVDPFYYVPYAYSGYGGGICAIHSTCKILYNEIRNNQAKPRESYVGWYLGRGGGIYVDGGSVIIDGNCILENETKSDGGGICAVEASTVTIQNNFITSNKSIYGSGVCIAYDAEAKVINNTFRYNVSSPLDVNCEAYVINNIFSADSSPTINTDTRLSALYNNAFDEISVIFNYGAFSCTDVATLNASFTFAKNNIACYPEFVSSTDYHITKFSCCRGAGTDFMAPGIDFDSQPRPNGIGYDIGADEYYDQTVPCTSRIKLILLVVVSLLAADVHLWPGRSPN